MKVYAIADLHLLGNQEKPMEVFGDKWENHWNKIKNNWQKSVADDDIVLIPGDISWAMDIKDAVDDIKDIATLPGKQIFLKGNHDYWWSSLNKVRSLLSENQYVVQNDSVKIGDVVVAGSRGWLCPGMQEYKKSEEKIYNREQMRLELSLNHAKKLMDENSKLIVMMHFPPYNIDKQATLFTETIEKYNPDCVVFGHIHTPSRAAAFEGVLNGIKYSLCSCDCINFDPIRIL